MPGATVSLSRKRPSRPWMRTSPPPALLTMSLACRMASAWVWGVLGVSGLHIPTAVRVADDIAVVGRRHDGSSSARDSLESEIRMRRREVRPHFDGMLRACKIGVRPQRRVLRLNRWDRFERVTLIRLVEEVEDDSVDLLITSPPYWGIRTYGLPHDESVLDEWRSAGCNDERTPPFDWYSRAGGVLGLEPYPHWYIDHLVEFFSKARRTLRSASSLWVNLGDTYFSRWSSIRDGGRQGLNGGRTRRRTPSGGYLHDKQLLLVPARFAIAMQDQGWILRKRSDLGKAEPDASPGARPAEDVARALVPLRPATDRRAPTELLLRP